MRLPAKVQRCVTCPRHVAFAELGFKITQLPVPGAPARPAVSPADSALVLPDPSLEMSFLSVSTTVTFLRRWDCQWPSGSHVKCKNIFRLPEPFLFFKMLVLGSFVWRKSSKTCHTCTLPLSSSSEKIQGLSSPLCGIPSHHRE